MPDRTLRERSPGDYTGQVYRRLAIAAAEKRQHEERMKLLDRQDLGGKIYSEDEENRALENGTAEVIDYVNG